MKNSESRAVTLRDVAAKAGVNATTVSVVLNRTRSGTRVSEATRQRILDTASELGYRANVAARGIKQGRMNAIGVVAVIDTADELDLYFLEVFNGILEEATRQEQNTTVFSIQSWSEERDRERVLQFCDGRIDGMICIGTRPDFSPEFATQLARHTPFVVVHANESLPDRDIVLCDDEGGGYLATRFLLEAGHRRILHLGVDPQFLGGALRAAGYVRAMVEAGETPWQIVAGGFQTPYGRKGMQALLERTDRDSLPTAIFCASDSIAAGCLEAAAAAGIRVPEDLSVVGFDDMLTARMTAPQLTTVRQPFREIGAKAVTLLLTHRERSGEPTTVVFPVTLIERGSTAPPPRP